MTPKAIGNSNTADSHIPIGQPALRSLLRTIFRDATAIRASRISEGVSTWIYCVTRGDDRFYLRILPEKGATFAPEVRAHELIRQVGANVPEVLYFEPLNEHVQRSVMLTSEIPGRPLGPDVEPETARQIVIEAGRDLARINSIPVNGFGWVRRDTDDVPDRLTAEHATHLAFALENLDPHLDTLRTHTLTDREVANVRSVLRDCAPWLHEPEGRLAHGDFDTSHIFVHEGKYAGIIDFGEIRGASPYYDLGHHLMHDGERLPYQTLPFLLEGYADIVPLPPDHHMKISFFSLLNAIRAAGRGLQRSPDSQIVRTALFSLRRDMCALVDSI